MQRLWLGSQAVTVTASEDNIEEALKAWPYTSWLDGFKEKHLHVKYKYELHRASMPRNGGGDLYLNFGARPRIRLQGVAHSPKFGKGDLPGILGENRQLQ